MYGSRGRSKWFTLLSNARLAGKLPNVHQLPRRKVHNNISTLFKRSIFVPAKLFSRQETTFFLFFELKYLLRNDKVNDRPLVELSSAPMSFKSRSSLGRCRVLMYMVGCQNVGSWIGS